MADAYIRDLQLKIKLQKTAVVAPASLAERIYSWHSGLSEFLRNRPFSMSELEQVTASQGRFISPVLIQLGWSRKRKWDSQGSYHRYWVPPMRSQ